MHLRGHGEVEGIQDGAEARHQSLVPRRRGLRALLGLGSGLRLRVGVGIGVGIGVGVRLGVGFGLGLGFGLRLGLGLRSGWIRWPRPGLTSTRSPTVWSVRVPGVKDLGRLGRFAPRLISGFTLG